MYELTFITSHTKKAKEISWYLGHPVTHHKLDLPELQSLNPHEVVSAKAKEAYDRLHCPVLVEDFSIRFAAMGELPGPLIRWFLSELKPEGLCRLLNGYDDRSAIIQDCFALCDKNGVFVCDGVVKGVVANKPQGRTGYGTDAIFIPDGWQKTWGQMNKQEQMITSVRRIALQKLEACISAKHVR